MCKEVISESQGKAISMRSAEPFEICLKLEATGQTTVPQPGTEAEGLGAGIDDAYASIFGKEVMRT